MGVIACGRSNEEMQAEWDEIVAGAIACTADADCILVTPGCPFGCAAVINAAHKDEVEAKAKELREEASQDGSSCVYSCILPQTLSCENMKCMGQ